MTFGHMTSHMTLCFAGNRSYDFLKKMSSDIKGSEIRKTLKEMFNMKLDISDARRRRLEEDKVLLLCEAFDPQLWGESLSCQERQTVLNCVSNEQLLSEESFAVMYRILAGAYEKAPLNVDGSTFAKYLHASGSIPEDVMRLIVATQCTISSSICAERAFGEAKFIYRDCRYRVSLDRLEGLVILYANREWRGKTLYYESKKGEVQQDDVGSSMFLDEILLSDESDDEHSEKCSVRSLEKKNKLKEDCVDIPLSDYSVSYIREHVELLGMYCFKNKFYWGRLYAESTSKGGGFFFYYISTKERGDNWSAADVSRLQKSGDLRLC